jgi:hypothetical protein
MFFFRGSYFTNCGQYTALYVGVTLQDTAMSLILATNFLIFSANDLVVSEQKYYQSYSSLSFSIYLQVLVVFIRNFHYFVQI